MKSFPYSYFINSIDCLLRQYLKMGVGERLYGDSSIIFRPP